MKKKTRENDNTFGVINLVTPEKYAPNALKETSVAPVANAPVANPTMPYIDSKKVRLGVHKMYPDVVTPEYATKNSACFDLKAYFGDDIFCVDSYNRILDHSVRSVGNLPEKGYKRGVHIEPGECVYIPTGIIFDIPEGYKLVLAPRSGVSSKKHLKLANCVGKIDDDYVKQVFILLFNDSEMRQSIAHGDRIAQCEIVPVYRATFFELKTPPETKTDRNGGMGHTGG